jgi:hypothetical protein
MSVRQHAQETPYNMFGCGSIMQPNDAPIFCGLVRALEPISCVLMP